MSTITLKLQKTDSDFLEVCASKIYDVNGNDFYHIPFWFEKIGNGLFVQYGFDDLPKELINRIKEDRGCKEEVNESKPTEQFIWTDELVAECYEFIRNDNAGILTPVGVQKNIEQFKQSKSKKEEPQWEILELRRPSDFDLVHCLKITDKRDIEKLLRVSPEEFKIYSVKRSDGEVFSVGDVVYYKDGSEKSEPIRWCIDNFYIREDKVMLARSKDCTLVETIDNNCYLKKQAPKEEQVPIKVHDFHKHSNSDKETWYSFLVGGHIPESKYQSIKSAIEDVLNNKYKPWKMYQTGFTSEELLQARRDAFVSGYIKGWCNGCFEKDKTLSKKITDKKFEDYINSLK